MSRSAAPQLQRLLHTWRLTRIATSQVGYCEEVAAARNGTAQTGPAEEIVPAGWSDWRRRGLGYGDPPGRVKSAALRQLGDFPAKAFDARSRLSPE
jgi:hypothetical protein